MERLPERRQLPYPAPWERYAVGLGDSAEGRARAEAAYERLRTDTRIEEAIGGLSRRGLDEHAIRDCIVELPAVFVEWESLQGESFRGRRRRHAALAKKLRALADEMEQHADTRDLHFLHWASNIFYYAALSIPGMRAQLRSGEASLVPLGGRNFEMAPKPTVAQLLKGTAHFLKNGSAIHCDDLLLFDEMPPKKQFRAYAIGRTANAVDTLRGGRGRALNKETAQLVNVLLGLKGVEAVTPNDVTQSRKKTRDRYNKPEREARRQPAPADVAARPCRSAPTVVIMERPRSGDSEQ